MIIHLTRSTHIVDGNFRPLATSLTVAEAGAYLLKADLPLYVEARFRLEPTAPVSIDKQMAAKTRRLHAIAAACRRHVVRVDPVVGMTHQYRALLAR